MTRKLTLTLAMALPFALATTVRAQTTPYDVTGLEIPSNSSPDYSNLPHGGFGFDYSQPVVEGDVVMDQYGFLHGTGPMVASSPVVTVQPRPQQRARTSRSLATRGSARPRYQLPTGSLGWTGGEGAILYSPVARQQSYGSGYDRGPYGVTDYNYMYKGWPQ
jgi:hypothetical protein